MMNEVKDMILDYSKYVKYRASKGMVNFHNISESVELFYEKDGFCQYCNQPANRIINNHKSESSTWLDGSFWQTEHVFQCPTCGWWEYIYNNRSDAVDDGIVANDKEKNSAILQQYNIGDISIPMEVLSEYIIKNPTKIHDIHYTAMEKLVQSIFSEHFSCDVQHVGQSHDGGKDLVAIMGDEKYVIQVKRRINPNATEPVNYVRELLGVAYMEDANSCAYVTTADHFTRDATKFANDAITKEKVKSFKLVDRNSFLSMMEATRKDMPNAWEKFIQLK